MEFFHQLSIGVRWMLSIPETRFNFPIFFLSYSFIIRFLTYNTILLKYFTLRFLYSNLDKCPLLQSNFLSGA